MNTRTIQKELRGLGLYLGDIDGINGKGTKEAIRAFQRINPPLDPDGKAGKLTLAELFHDEVEVDEPHGPESDNILLPAGEFPKERDVPGFYGERGKNQVLIHLPYPLLLAWELDTHITQFQCHQRVALPMRAIFEDILEKYGLQAIKDLRLDRFGGCLNDRPKRGGSMPSMHSWGIAVDLNPARNRLRWGADQAAFAGKEYELLWEIVYSHNAISLGIETGRDFMHFQFARLNNA